MFDVQMMICDIPVFDVQVTQEQYLKAFDYLEKVLEKKVFLYDLDDFKGMVEQVTSESLTKR